MGFDGLTIDQKILLAKKAQFIYQKADGSRDLSKWRPDLKHDLVQDVVDKLDDQELQQYAMALMRAGREAIIGGYKHGRDILTVSGFMVSVSPLVKCRVLWQVLIGQIMPETVEDLEIKINNAREALE